MSTQNSKLDNYQPENQEENNIIELEGKGTREEIQLRKRAQKSDFNPVME